jgi:fatty-acyl-CoA synthase
VNQKDITRRFDGYTDKKATEKKIVTGVMKDGDVWFRTGDLLRKDKEGFVYFVDRIGDTFRWKGENVSTNEVAEVVSAVPGIAECNVYGVQVPTKAGSVQDGRAGMASLVMGDLSRMGDDAAGAAAVAAAVAAGGGESKAVGGGGAGGDVDALLAAIFTYTADNLAVYQVPLFIRVQGAMVITATFKHKKVELVKDGMDPVACAPDMLFFRDHKVGAYVPLTDDLYRRIVEGQVKL